MHAQALFAVGTRYIAIFDTDPTAAAYIPFSLISRVAVSLQNVISTRETARWYATCKHLALAVDNKDKFFTFVKRIGACVL